MTQPAGATDAWRIAQRMGKGINVLGYDPIWSDPTKARFTARHFALIRSAGFNTIRVNLEAFAHMDAQNRLYPQWLTTLDWVVNQATAQGLFVILDEHDYYACGKDAHNCDVKLTAFWQQIAQRYEDAPETVLFELLNEPNGKITPKLWNVELAKLLNLVRRNNPTRIVVIGPADYNNLQKLPELKLPPYDDNIIVSFHYYGPIQFTHQGAPWISHGKLPTGITWGSDLDRQELKANFDLVQQWSKQQFRPIFLSEFGAYDKGDMTSRAAYTAAVAKEAEQRGWPWAYWQFDKDFIAFDMKTGRWVQPILDALMK